MIRLALIAVSLLALAVPAAAQPVDHSQHGVTKPSPKPAARPAPKAKPSNPKTAPRAVNRTAPAVDPHAGHDMSKVPGAAMPAQPPTAPPPAAGPDMPMPMPAAAAPDPHADHSMTPSRPLPVIEPQASPPPVPTDHAADRAFDTAEMAAARALVEREHGGSTYSKVMADIFEYQARSGGDGYRWEGQAWVGGDLNRFVVRTEGEGTIDRDVEKAEVQLLYSRTIGPYFNLRTGVRQDFRPTPQRTYATVGVEGLAPYWFELDGALFLSTKGEVLARAEGSYDLRLTQHLILQPRAEFNFAAQSTRATGMGSGLSTAELEMRLRYEIRREFAPYIGVSYERSFGRTADYARSVGDGVEGTSFVVGIRAWF